MYMNLLHKKGQSFLEFGIVLLIAIPFVFGTYFVFILCYDYMTVASLARESVRELSVQTTSTMSTARDAIITRKANGKTLLGSYYVWNPTKGIANNTPDAFLYDYDSGSTTGDMYVTVTMTATKAQGGLNDIFSILPNTIKATSTMYWEGSTSSSQ
jgi:hypothetical protein